MVTLTTAASPFAARVLAAHLGAEGIVWELRGSVDGPYPVGPVEVLVAEGDLAMAREIVAEQSAAGADFGGVDTEGVGAGTPGGGAGARGDGSSRGLWAVLVLVLLAAALLLGRLVESTWAEGSAQVPSSPLPASGASGASGVGVAVSSAGAGGSPAAAAA
jgi:Putative prokaryotic signal transducing protein